MKEKEFNLSEKIMQYEKMDYGYLDKEDVKEFIRRLKKGIASINKRFDTLFTNKMHIDVEELLDNLAGDKLTGGINEGKRI